MLTQVNPKLPMRDKAATKAFYISSLGFMQTGSDAFDDYLMLRRDGVEIHFFRFKELQPASNYGQMYIRTNDIDALYQSFLNNGAPIHPNGPLAVKPWGQKEFSILDPDNNLLTFGQAV